MIGIIGFWGFFVLFATFGSILLPDVVTPLRARKFFLAAYCSLSWGLYAISWTLFVLAVLDTVGMCVGILFVAASIALAVRIHQCYGGTHVKL